MDGIDISGWGDAAGGLAGSATDWAGFINPNTLSVVTPGMSTLSPDALGVVGDIAEDGANAATQLVPSLTPNATMVGGGAGYVQPSGLAGNAIGTSPSWITGASTVIPGNVGNLMNSGGTFNHVTNQITDSAGNLYNVGSDGGLAAAEEPKSIFDKGLGFFNDNSKGLEAGGKLVGGLGGLYYQNQMSGLAKQQLKDSRENTAHNRARQAAADANLQSASDRVFGKYNG